MMHRKPQQRSHSVVWAVCLIALSALCVAAPATAEEILGFFEGNGNENGATGAVPLTGWVYAESGVRTVTIFVDGVEHTNANLGLRREDVSGVNPGVGSFTGFGVHMNSPDFVNGTHEVSAWVLTFDGNFVELPGTRNFLFVNNTSILVPFGRIDIPDPHAELFGYCNLATLPRRYSVISGWALDLGLEIGDAGVGYVQLLIDGAIVSDTRTGCDFDLATGGLTNCYGLRRLDIENRYPFAFDSPSAGYRFAIDVGELVDGGWVQGQHVLATRVGDLSTQTATVHEIPVTFYCVENLGNEGAFGMIESPHKNGVFAGPIDFVGWALDGEGVASVEIYVDGELIGTAAYGLGQGSRPEVIANYPGFPNTFAPVYRLEDVDSTQFTDGTHTVQVVVTDLVGVDNLVGEREFVVDNGVGALDGDAVE